MERFYRHLWRISAFVICLIYQTFAQNLIQEAPLMQSVDTLHNRIVMTDPCQYPVPVGMEKNYIPDKNIWATSITNRLRGPQYARLRGWRGGGAWTAGTTDDNQYLGIDLGYRQVITAVSTQGRRGSNEFVLEYYLHFSSDNQTWTVYTNEYGTPMMFEANTDDNTVVRNNLDYPIIARYININPQRWNRFISLRVELYGCRFDAEGAFFDGQSSITYDLSGSMEYVMTRNDSMTLRFKTAASDGLLFFADGNQGDYFILELVRGRLYLNINLGTTANMSGDTTMRVGSLLDDNLWHEVEINRTGRELTFNVDRLTLLNYTLGDFVQLDLDKKIYLGGIDNFLQPGKRLLSRQNFSGCMENVWFNYMSIIKDSRMNQPRFQINGNVQYGLCQLDSVIPFTFPAVYSYLKITKDTDSRLRSSFDFRSYNRDGLMLMVQLNPGGLFWITINLDGHIEYTVQTSTEQAVHNVITNRDAFATSDSFTDGQWHSVYIDVQSTVTLGTGRVNITIDGRSDVSLRKLTFTTSTDFLIGGGDNDGGRTGFLGCMRNVIIMGDPINNIPQGSNIGGVMNGTCTLQDRCDPNPCEHLGVCSQEYNTFSCDCQNTGYTGAVCHISSYLVSCEEAKLLYPILPELAMMIDIDDSGPLDPFPVNCVFQSQQTSIMELYHDSGDETLVDGYAGPGSYVRQVVYNAKKEEVDEIINRALYCEQYIKWECFQSKLLTDAGSNNPTVIPSWGWWVGRQMNAERYWGGSSPDSGKCMCGLKSECKSSGGGIANNPCNCDASLAQQDVFDDGYIMDKDRLPVMEMHFGDTGNIGDQKWGKHTLGPLRCYGDNLFNNVVTFRKEDASIELPTYPGAVTGDIRFQFRTTALNGVILQNTGSSGNFIEVRLVFGNILQFRFNVGNGIQTLEKMTAYPLNDDNWHTVLVERNRKQARLRIDLQAPITLDEPTDQEFRPFYLDSPLILGAAVDLSDGFVGCVRAMQVSGVAQDIRGIVESGEVTYGVTSGCHPKCESNPCYNNGICVEWYSRYQCDCAYTPFRGWDCGREMGVTMQPEYMIRYTFDPLAGDISTDEENIWIGFSTQEKHGQIMFIRSDSNPIEYISIEINNNGGVKVIIDVGFYRDEVNTDIQDVDLTNGQQHVVHVRRLDHGSTMVVEVDEYTPAIKKWDLPPNTDSRMDSPRYIYFGRNETTRPGDGYKGCLFRAQWDNQYPINRVFQDPRGPQIYLEPASKIREDMCGFEEITHAPDPFEFRPTIPPIYRTTPDQFIVGGGLDVQGGIILGVIVGVAIIALLLLILLLVRYYYKQKRQYKTYEAKGAQYFDNPDYAIASGSTLQPEVQNKKEYFM